MKSGLVLAALSVVGLALFWVVVLMTLPKVDATYRCDLAEISPDFPARVKEKCRDLRRGA